MSLTFPLSRIKHELTTPVADRVVVGDFKLPSLDQRDKIRVMPFDAGIGRVASQAVLATGAEIFSRVMGEKDTQLARERAVKLSQRLIELGADVVHKSNPLLSKQVVDSSEIARVVAGNWVELKEPVVATPVSVDTPTGQYSLPDGAHHDTPGSIMQVYTAPKKKTEQDLVDEQIADLWETKAINGDEAMVTLLAMRDLALTQPDTLEGGLASHSLEPIRSQDTNIALK